MVELATARLNDAAETLPPAERALLNLWIRNGLDDQALSRMTGMTPDALLARRERIVEHLSASLELSPGDVTTALADLAAGAPASAETAPEVAAPNGVASEPTLNGNGASAQAPVAEEAAPEPEAQAPAVDEAAPEPEAQAPAVEETAPEVEAPDTEEAEAQAADTMEPQGEGRPAVEPATEETTEPTAETAPEPTAEAAPEPTAAAAVTDADTPPAPPQAPATEEPWHRRHFTLVLMSAVAVLVILLVVLLANRGHAGTGGSHSTTAASVSTSASASTSASSTTSAPAPVAPRVEPLTDLPGGLTGTTGTVRLTGSGSSLRLELRVTHLPAAAHAHYEVWLYNSIIDATALGGLPAGTHALSFRLPAGASRYGFIDISVQPPGMVNPSGESVLRAVDPAAS